MQATNRMKVLCPIERKKEGEPPKTFWLRVGSAFTNRDGSFNVYLDALPTNNKLQIRELDERDLKKDAPASSGDDALPF